MKFKISIPSLVFSWKKVKNYAKIKGILKNKNMILSSNQLSHPTQFPPRLIYQAVNNEKILNQYTETEKQLVITREELKQQVQDKIMDISEEQQLLKQAVGKLKTKISNGEKNATENIQCFGQNIQIIMQPDYTYQAYITENRKAKSIEVLPWAIEQRNKTKKNASA